MRISEALDVVRSMEPSSSIEPLILRAAELFVTDANHKWTPNLEATTWRKFFEAVIHYPDPVFRPSFELALQRIPQCDAEAILPTALLTLIYVPREARSWAAELARKSLTECSEFQTSAISRAAEALFIAYGIDMLDTASA